MLHVRLYIYTYIRIYDFSNMYTPDSVSLARQQCLGHVQTKNQVAIIRCKFRKN